MRLADALSRYPGAVTYRPGDSAALNAEILALVRSGRKTVTCEAWSAFGVDEPLPEPGRIDIALDWTGCPAYAAETLRVDKIQLCDMTEDRIPAQGEFRDLAHWRKGYRNYLERAGLFALDVPMMVETFRLVEDFGDV